MVLFRLNWQCTTVFPGLKPGVIPVFPCQWTFTVKMANGQKFTITHRQLPLMPAGAYTDFRAQGGNIDPVAADIGKTSSLLISPFNAYVALSHSRGKGWSTIRILKTLYSCHIHQKIVKIRSHSLEPRIILSHLPALFGAAAMTSKNFCPTAAS